jgi:hypothetical protein
MYGVVDKFKLNKTKSREKTKIKKWLCLFWRWFLLPENQ